MGPAFLLAAYFVYGWLEHRTNPTTLLSAIGAISAGVVIACANYARESISSQATGENVASEECAVALVESCTPRATATQVCEEAQVEVETPQNPWFTKGIRLVEAKQYRDALYCFSYVLQSDPNNQAALTAKGDCLMRLNRPEEALKAFMAAAQIDTDDPLAQEGKMAVLRKVRAATWL